MYPYLYTICLYSVYIPTHGRRVLRGLGAQGFPPPPPPRPPANCSGGLALPLPQPGVLIHFIKLLIYAIFNCVLDPPSNLQIVQVQTPEYQYRALYFQTLNFITGLTTRFEPTETSKHLSFMIGECDVRNFTRRTLRIIQGCSCIETLYSIKLSPEMLS